MPTESSEFIKYMGTKRHVANAVASAIDLNRQGPILDLFSGMGAVADRFQNGPNVWINDQLTFPYKFGAHRFCSTEDADTSQFDRDIFLQNYKRNKNELSNIFKAALTKEADIFASPDADYIASYIDSIRDEHEQPHVTNTLSQFQRNPGKFPYCYISFAYANTYFSRLQCIEIDSLRYAIDMLFREYGCKTTHTHGLITLCHAAILRANSPGHFAQYLKPKPASLNRYLADRERSVFETFRSLVPYSRVCGNAEWRLHNKSFNEDATTLLSRFLEEGTSPSIIYADPPYTTDQYSRYYHLFDTLISYDYSLVASKGRYPANRPVSLFSLKSRVSQEFDKLFSYCRKLGSTMVLSYPTGGLLEKAGVDVLELLRQHFAYAEIVTTLNAYSSTFGGSTGAARQQSTDNIYRALP